MLNDIRDLLEDEDSLYPEDEENSRRKYYIIGGIAGGILLLGVICFGVFAVILGGGDETLEATLTNGPSTLVASNPNGTPGSELPPSLTPTPVPPTATSAPSPTIEPSPTGEPPTATATEEEASLPTEPPPATTTPAVTFQEDFEGSGGVWPGGTNENYDYGMEDGGFRVNIFSNFIEVWNVRERSYDDVRLETDIEINPGIDDGYAGVICRFQDGFNFYAGIIDGAGNYAIFKRSGRQLLELAASDESTPARAGGETNRLRLDCVGPNLQLSVNGSLSLEAIDDAFDEGPVGLVAGTLETAGLETFFDNFIIAEP